tara:strand:- start:1292 stop:4120 length:2829 start_codon:yes stop_codon:yes gene_type:complete
MTIDTLSSLYPVHQIGSDGFNWWIGQIESVRADDKKGGGRYKVRILGLHPKECIQVGSDQLPWARVMMPVTFPHTPGGATAVHDQLSSGVWVVGFFLDTDKQQPMIMGSVGGDPNSSPDPVPDDPSPGESGCKSFTHFVDPKNKIYFDQDPTDTTERPIGVMGGASDGIGRDNQKGITNFTKAKFANNSTTNPAGIDWCMTVATECGEESDLQGTFMRLFGEMLHETQRNNGKLGNYLVGELSGGLYDSIGIGRKYVNKSIRVMRTFVASVKGFVLAKIKEAIKWLVDALIYPNPTGNSLTGVTKFFNDMLAHLGCEMADLGDRLAKFLEDLIFGYLFNIYKSTMCQVDKFVEGILNKIQSLMTDLLNKILGPLQDILGAIAAPLNMIGDAINYVLNLLGIQCNGPKKGCSSKTKQCTNCAGSERQDFLDKLLEDLEGWPTGQDWSQYTCPDAYTGNTITGTTISFVGGVQVDNPLRSIQYDVDDIFVKEGQIASFIVKRTGKTDIASSITYSTRAGTATGGTDYEEVDGVLGFSPGETEKTIQVATYVDSEDEGDEDFFMRIFKESPSEGSGISSVAKKNVGRCVITESTIRQGVPTQTTPGEVTTSNPEFSFSSPISYETFVTPDTPVIDGGEDPVVDLNPTYVVTADKASVKEGDFITYSIKTTNVPSGTVLSYRLFGPNITPSDIISNNLSGTFIIEADSSVVIVGISEDNNFETAETLTFSIPGTGAQTSVLIESDEAGLSEEEIVAQEDESSLADPAPEFSLPTAGEVITGPDGEIISVPIANPGDAYKEPPTVFLTGNGYRASGIVLTDNKGLVQEIRITDPGFGYKINTPDNAAKECIIDSFTMIRPGQEYETIPTVYVNGDPSVAEAVIDAGRIISVRIKNRELTFNEYPEIIIIGGGGYGAKFIPSFSCLSPEDRVRIGSAKIGTGRYVDCP